jgi:hypothetical protein
MRGLTRSSNQATIVFLCVLITPAQLVDVLILLGGEKKREKQYKGISSYFITCQNELIPKKKNTALSWEVRKLISDEIAKVTSITKIRCNVH